MSAVGMYRNNKIGTKQGGKNWYLLDIKLPSKVSLLDNYHTKMHSQGSVTQPFQQSLSTVLKQYTKFLYNWVIKFLWRLYQTFQTPKGFMKRKQRSLLQRTYGNQILTTTKCWKLELWIPSTHFLSEYYKRTLCLIFLI